MPNPSVTPEKIRDGINELARILENLASSSGSDLHRHYQDWVALAQVRMREYFEDAAVVDELHTVRFWTLMTMADIDSDRSPFSMQLQLEMKVQTARLLSVRQEVEKIQRTFAVDGDGALVVIYTNGLIHGKWFEDVDWAKELRAKRVKVVLPHVVIDELDDISHRRNTDADTARKVLKHLRVRRAGVPAHEPVELGHGATIQILLDPRGHSRLLDRDAEIIERALFLDRLASSRLVVMTGDNGMNLRATALALTVVDYPARPNKSNAPTI